MKYIYHHLGLGDHIICNGLVRELVKHEENYKMFVKSHNLNTVKFMYRDLKNLDFIVSDDLFSRNFLRDNLIKNEDLIIAGFQRHPNSKYFDESFYLQNNLEYNVRWDKFKVERNLDKEYDLFKQFDVEEDKYVFIHDDKERGFEINEEVIKNKQIKIVRPILGLTDNVFDYCYLMEKSLESHFIDSSFRLIFDSLKLRNTNIFYHLRLKSGKGRNGEIYSWSDSVNSYLNFQIID